MELKKCPVPGVLCRCALSVLSPASPSPRRGRRSSFPWGPVHGPSLVREHAASVLQITVSPAYLLGLGLHISSSGDWGLVLGARAWGEWPSSGSHSNLRSRWEPASDFPSGPSDSPRKGLPDGDWCLVGFHPDLCWTIERKSQSYSPFLCGLMSCPEHLGGEGCRGQTF